MTDTTTVTVPSLDEFVQAHKTMEQFREFVLDRFKSYAKVFYNLDVDEITRNGWTRFYVADRSLLDADAENVTVVRHTADERSAGTSQNYALPKSALFNPTDAEKAYKQWKEAARDARIDVRDLR